MHATVIVCQRRDTDMRSKLLLPIGGAGVIFLLAMLWGVPETLSGTDALLLAALGASIMLVAAACALELAIRRPLARALRSDEAEADAGADPLHTARTKVADLHRSLRASRGQLAAEGARRQAAEDALRDAEERYQIAVRNAADGAWEWELAEDRFTLSERWKGMLGYGSGEIPDKREAYLERIHPEDVEVFTAALERHLSGATAKVEHEHRLCNRDGVWRWVLSRACALRHANGKPYRLIGLDTDITRARRVEDALIRVAEQTAGTAGTDYFRNLVRTFAQALDWQGALITECADHPATRLRILAFWCDGSFLEDFEYDLAGTACEEVVCNDAPFFVATGVGERYPKEAGWQAYLGLPIRSGAGEVLGHLAFVDRRKMSAEVLQMPIYQSFIARAAGEIERRHQLHTQSAPMG